MEATSTQTATAEYANNIGHDFATMDAEDSDYLETEEDADAEAQRINKAMAEWFGM